MRISVRSLLAAQMQSQHLRDAALALIGAARARRSVSRLLLLSLPFGVTACGIDRAASVDALTGSRLTVTVTRLTVRGSFGTAGNSVSLKVYYRRQRAGLNAPPVSDVVLLDTAIVIGSDGQDISMRIPLGQCLADSEREVVSAGCPLRVSAVLRGPDLSAADSADVGPIDVQAGGTVSAPALALSPIDSINVAAPSTVLVADSGIATATVHRRDGTSVGDRSIVWRSSDATIATVSTEGAIATLRPGPVTITASIGSRVGQATFTVLTRSAIAFYPFDGNAHDASGYGRHGTVFGATLTADRLGNANSAYFFGGNAGSYINIGVLPLTGSFTIAAFIRPDDTSLGWSVVSSLDNVSGRGYEFLLLRPSEGQALRLHTSLSTAVTATNSPLQTGRWYFVAATFSQGVGRIYLDGVLVQTQNNMPSAVASGLPTLIGKSGYGTFNFANGAIDNVSIFDRALDASEIDSLFRSGGRPQ